MPRSEWDPKHLPALLKCMTMAVFRKNKGKEDRRFTDALAAARTTLVKIRYATASSLKGPLESFQLTAAGLKKNKDHLADTSKHLQFNKLFLRYRSLIEVEEKRRGKEDLKGDDKKDQAES